jgi:lipopolysaccharide/colanic/teichoic acid biosynthesis glycosyltransferase
MKSALRRKKAVITPLRTNMFCDYDSVCYVEEFFLEFLVFERRRSERSGRPFLVMTLDFTGIRDLESRGEPVKWTMKTLSMLTRDTDIKGWYRNTDILGVIFTEMNSLETETLQKKIYASLHSSLTDEQLSVIRIAFHRFPDEGKPDKPGKSSDFTFYPDYPKQEQSRRTALKMKRVMDVVGSIVGILIFFPVFILAPLGIKLTSRGPVLFRQKRVGQYAKPFMFLKFRSMYDGNSEDVHKEFVHNLISKKTSSGAVDPPSGQKVYKITNDKRVTSIGKFLRKTSLDELPQFFNVLKGEMSLAGPRPPIPYELEKYDSWHLRRVLEIKPGITGLWQVVGRSSTSFDEMVRLDLHYATNWSLWLDIKILLKTPWVLMAGKGAY